MVHGNPGMTTTVSGWLLADHSGRDRPPGEYELGALLEPEQLPAGLDSDMTVGPWTP